MASFELVTGVEKGALHSVSRCSAAGHELEQLQSGDLRWIDTQAPKTASSSHRREAKRRRWVASTAAAPPVPRPARDGARGREHRGTRDRNDAEAARPPSAAWHLPNIHKLSHQTQRHVRHIATARSPGSTIL